MGAFGQARSDVAGQEPSREGAVDSLASPATGVGEIGVTALNVGRIGRAVVVVLLLLADFLLLLADDDDFRNAQHHEVLGGLQGQTQEGDHLLHPPFRSGLVRRLAVHRVVLERAHDAVDLLKLAKVSRTGQ